METFGEKLRALRLAKGMQQKDVAALIDVDVTYLSKVETSRQSPPSEETIRKLAEVLDGDADTLILAADKVPSEVRSTILQAPQAHKLLRTARNFGDDEWDKLVDLATRLAKGAKT